MLAPRTRMWPRFALAVALIAVIFGGGIAAAAVTYLSAVPPGCEEPLLGDSGSDGEFECDEPIPLPDVEPGEPRTILLLGSDKRSKKAIDAQAAGKPRADTMMLVRLDPQQGAMAVLSIPRDTKVEIPQDDGTVRTGKINEAYADGGAQLTIKTVERFLDIPINHYVVTQFGAFSRAVNRLGCVYQDVDRTYFNDNSGPGDNYATIDVKAGYQLLCGQDTLDWVRYRHTDSDFVRGARQQEFLRSAKGQLGLSELLGNRGELIGIARTYVQSDVRSAGDILSVAKATADSRKQPVRSITFRGTTSEDPSDTYVTVTPENLQQMRDEFIKLTASKTSGAENKDVASTRRQRKSKQPKRAGLAQGLFKSTEDAQRQDFTTAEFTLAGGGLPMRYPSVRLAKGGYYPVDPVRVYQIVSRTKQRYASYRLTFSYGEFGQYWGVQGTTWKNPPILDERHSTRRRGGKTLDVYKAGSRYRLVALRTDDGVYWVRNTLGNLLSNSQMLDIAAGLRPVSGS